MIEITVGICESFKMIGIDISEVDLRRFEAALYERGLNVAPRRAPPPEPTGVVQLATKLLDFIDNEGPCAREWEPISATAEALREAIRSMPLQEDAKK